MNAIIFFYGFRFFGTRSNTMGTPHPRTFRYSKAGDFEVFDTERRLEDWLDGEDLKAEREKGGGERIRVSLRDLKKIYSGMAKKDFDIEVKRKITDKFHFFC